MGTGKTVVAIHRATWLQNRNNQSGSSESIDFLMYSTVLKAFTKQTVDSAGSKTSDISPLNLMGWVREWHKIVFGSGQVPKIDRFNADFVAMIQKGSILFRMIQRHI